MSSMAIKLYRHLKKGINEYLQPTPNDEYIY